MKWIGIALLGIFLAASGATTTAETNAPDAGDVAPAFTLPGSDGTTYTLADLKGDRAVVIAWFPAAFTSG
jgi:peroxiredoxin Q/BCP